MNVQITHKNWVLPEAERDQLERRVARIQKKLPRINADQLHLVVCVDKHAVRDEFMCSARLMVLGEVLAVRGKFNMTPRTAITEAFDDVEKRLDKFLASLHAHV